MLLGGFFFFNLVGVYELAGLIKKLFVGADRCVRPSVSMSGWLMIDGFGDA